MKGPRIVASRLASLISIAVLSAAVAGGALAGAQTPDPRESARRHLLVVPADPAGEAALARTDARLVARYGAFSLVEAGGADDARLRRAGADRRDDMRRVRTAAGYLDPRSGRASLAGKQAPGRSEVLSLVQFVGPPKDAWLERLRATGARIVTYQAENSYVVHASGEEIDRLSALVGGYAPVRTVAVLTAADKLEGGRGRSGRYAVQTVAGARGRQARADAAAAGAGVSRSVRLGRLQTQYIALSHEEAAELARDPAVVAVEPYGEPELADERGAQMAAGNLTGFVPSGPGYLDWLVHPDRIPDQSTFGFVLDVTDEGLDAYPLAHPDFRELGSGAGASRVAYRNNYSSDPDTRDCGGHGTNVASIAAGYNNGTGPAVEDGAGYNHGLGAAPFAQLGVSKIFHCAGGYAPFTPATVASNAYGAEARISNNSWGTGTQAGWGSYSTRAQEYDAVVRDARASDPGNQELVEVFAAGNDGDDNPGVGPNEGYGTILAEGTAKNVITVGAAEGVRPFGTDGCGVTDGGADSARDIVHFASRGPTDDGRLKPDLVAPGSHMVGARPRHAGYMGGTTCNPFFGGPSTFYSLISGSSQAAPHVSGAAALVRHWYNRTEGANPSPALTKALLINTATDLAGGSTGKGATIAGGPNTDQGWGRVNVGSALDSTPREYRDQIAADTFGASGGTPVSRTYSVQDTTKPVKVTLVWTDPPGPASGNAWVNNLDLEVEANGDRYLGNVFAGAFSRTGGSADTRNNVESVFLPPGSSGRFAVTVKSLAVVGDGVPGTANPTDQDFALVVSNAQEEPAPVLVHAATTIADPALGGDNDGVLESGEQIELTELVRNAGTLASGPMVASLTGSAALSVSQPASPYASLVPGASGSNLVPFGAELANAATCGVDVPATLDITTTSPTVETQTVPLVLATGEPDPGPPLSTDAAGAQVPVAIPDDSGAGVTSSVFVSPRGRIKDINVRLPGTAASPGIEHDFVGDLVIDLIGPDGTTVRLAEHPGGPDNAGKDLVGTVFDDEAPQAIGAAGTAAPYTGQFKPQNDQLSRFDGKDRRGTWTLRVRDLFESDTGTLRAWGLSTQKALCNFDMAAPDTRVLSEPADPTDDSSPTFSFDSPDDPGATFECKLDSADYEPCASPKTYTGLAPGSRTFQVRAVDGSGNEDATAETVTWTIEDRVAPVVTLSQPANGSSTSDTTPMLAGVAGTLEGDDSTVTLKLWSGSLAAGLPAQTLIVPRDSASGAFSAIAATLAEGAYTVRAEQGDSALPSENIGVSSPVTFTVNIPETPPSGDGGAPAFAVAPVEERLSEALDNRYTVLAACDSACEIRATLGVSARAARKLGMRARAVTIGSGVKRLAKAGSAALKLRLTAAARRALRGQVGASAALKVRIRGAGGPIVTLDQTVRLGRGSALKRVAGQGLRLGTACSRRCALRGELGLSAASARKLGMKPKSARRVTIASGRAGVGPSPRKLVLKVSPEVGRALRGARQVTVLLEVSAGSETTKERRARRRLTLR